MQKKQRTNDDIIGLAEKYFTKFTEKRVTFYRADRRYKEKQTERGRLVFAKKYISKDKWESLQQNLVKPPEITRVHRGRVLPKGMNKVHFQASKCSVDYKLKSTGEKFKSTFIAYTKEHKEKFSEMLKNKTIPLQRMGGKPSKVIDLKKKYKEEGIVESKVGRNS